MRCWGRHRGVQSQRPSGQPQGRDRGSVWQDMEIFHMALTAELSALCWASQEARNRDSRAIGKARWGRRLREKYRAAEIFPDRWLPPSTTTDTWPGCASLSGEGLPPSLPSSLPSSLSLDGKVCSRGCQMSKSASSCPPGSPYKKGQGPAGGMCREGKPSKAQQSLEE